MSKAVKGIGKVFKKVAPIAVGVGLAYVTGGASAALMAGAKGLVGSALSGSSILGGGGSSSQSDSQNAVSQTATQATTIPYETTGMSAGSTDSGGGAFDWMEKNPETAKMLAGLVGGAAKGYSAGKKHDELLAEKKRQFNTPYIGAFYGRRTLPVR